MATSLFSDKLKIFKEIYNDAFWFGFEIGITKEQAEKLMKTKLYKLCS